MNLADVYCLVCNKVDAEVEVEDDRGTMYIVHKDCAKSHEKWLEKSLHTPTFRGEPPKGKGK